MKKYKIQDTMYGCNFELIIDCSEKEIKNYIKRKFNLDLESNASGKYITLEYKNEKTQKCINKRIVYVEKFDWKIIDQGLLIHELLHYVFDNLNLLGIKYCHDSEEVYCYYLQHLLQQCYSKIKVLHPNSKKNVSRYSKIRNNKRIKSMEKSKK